MASSKAATVSAYLEELPQERRAVVSVVRAVVLENLPDGYVETMNWGMICYEIPLADYPHTYNGQPLTFTALAAQKNYYALYLSCAYQDPDERAWLLEEFHKVGKRPNLGKSCLRFQRPEDLPLEAIGALIARTPPATFITRHESGRARRDCQEEEIE